MKGRRSAGRTARGRVSVLLVAVLSVAVPVAPAAAGTAPVGPGTTVGPGTFPTVRPWISAVWWDLPPSEHPPQISLFVSGAGFPVGPQDAQGEQLGGFSVREEGGRSVGWPRPYALGAGFDCADRAVLDETCRYYAAGELRPFTVSITHTGQPPLPCGTRLTVRVSTGSSAGQAAETTVLVPCR